MNFELNEEQVLLGEAIERFAIDHCVPAQRRNHRACERGYSLENWRALADLGVLSLPFASSEGGLGGGEIELITVMEGLGRALAIEPVLEEIVLAGGLMAHAGSPQQREHWLPLIMSGGAHLVFAHPEPRARFRLNGLDTRARRGDGTYLLEGEKAVVPLGGADTGFIISAMDDDASGQSVGLYLVQSDAHGLQLRDLRLVDGSRACSLTLRGAPGERLPGGLGELARVADQVRIAACAEMVGIMSNLLEATLEHVRSRKQFGAALGNFQVIQHMLADLYVSLEQSRSQLYRAVLGNGNDRERSRTIAGAKSYVSAAALKLGEQCIQLHGGMGISEELPIGDGHKRVMLLSTLFGDSDYELDRYVRSWPNQRGCHE